MTLETGIGPAWRRRRARSWVLAAVGFGLCLALAIATYYALYASKLDAHQRADAQRLAFFGTSLEHTLEKHEQLPYVVALEQSVIALLRRPDDRALVASVNHYLEVVRARTEVEHLYLLDTTGLTLASSNWAQPTSFVGINYGYRPYFRAAVAGDLGRFYGMGTTTHVPGYFLSAPVRQDGRVIGVMVAKVRLEALEPAWERSGETILVSDENDIVFLSSAQRWKYRQLAPLSPDAARHVRETRQYESIELAPMLAGTAVRLDQGARTIRLPQHRMLQARPCGPLGWHMLLLSDLREVRGDALGGAAAVGFAAAFALTALIYFQLRRMRSREQRQAQAVLQRAYDQLEHRIAERTADLTAANARLEHKVAALKQTEQILRDTRDEAIQAGKLAVLGQMAAGVTHELNQPLTALTTLQDNAVKYIELGRLDEARDNLRILSQLTQKMGRIIGELKTFARKAPIVLAEVAVADSLASAQLLVEGQRRKAQVAIVVKQVDRAVLAIADSTRLEQILVNLLRNGIEAMETSSDRRLVVYVTREHAHVRIAVRDHGAGISAEVGDRLFEPFVTTKPVGIGLGLGLAISHAIAESVGGELVGANAPDGGAEFVLTLAAA